MAIQAVAKKDVGLPAMLKAESVKNRFAEVLDKGAPAFISAILAIYNGNFALQKCDAKSILGAAGLAATLKLSITPSLGHAYILPYRGQATFILGYKGLIQLAHRTGKYTRIHAGAVREGQIRGIDVLTGEPIIGEKISDDIVGYIAYFKLNNGFEKSLYMSKNEVEEHAKKYSQSYGSSSSPWTKNFNEMANKTVLKLLLNRWGILSADMVTAIQADQSVVDKNSFTYVDNGGNRVAREPVTIPGADEVPEIEPEKAVENTVDVKSDVIDPETDEVLKKAEEKGFTTGEEKSED